MKNTTKRLHRQILSVAAFLAVTVFIMGCSSTTNLSWNAKMKDLRLVKATPNSVSAVNRTRDLAPMPSNSYTASIKTTQPSIITASTNNDVVLSTLSTSKIHTLSTPVSAAIVTLSQNINSGNKVIETKANTTQVKSKKPKSNKLKLILLGLLAYMTLGGAMAATKHINDTKNNKRQISGGCKSWIAAFLLCTFLGSLGIHRFYLGYTWQGVVQLLTGGGCGIWAFIDWIRIITKDLGPKDGSYC